MEKQQNRNRQFNQIHTFDRIFTKARGVHLFPEEKDDILKALEKLEMVAEPIAVIETKKKNKTIS